MNKQSVLRGTCTCIFNSMLVGVDVHSFKKIHFHWAQRNNLFTGSMKNTNLVLNDLIFWRYNDYFITSGFNVCNNIESEEKCWRGSEEVEDIFNFEVIWCLSFKIIQPIRLVIFHKPLGPFHEMWYRNHKW